MKSLRKLLLALMLLGLSSTPSYALDPAYTYTQMTTDPNPRFLDFNFFGQVLLAPSRRSGVELIDGVNTVNLEGNIGTDDGGASMNDSGQIVRDLIDDVQLRNVELVLYEIESITNGVPVFSASVLAQESDFLPDDAKAIYFPRANNVGEAVFGVEFFDGVPTAIYRSNPNTGVTLVAPNGTIEQIAVRYSAINNVGQVAFLGQAVGESFFEIYVDDGTTQTRYVDLVPLASATPGDIVSLTLNSSDVLNFKLAFNDLGQLAFTADALNDDFSNIYLADGTGTPTLMVDGSDFGADLDNVDLSNSGDIAFLVSSTNVTDAIYTGPNPATDKLIAVGDTLFGQTVTSLGPPRINANGQIAFQVFLTDGTVGSTTIVRANPPGTEPGNPDIPDPCSPPETGFCFDDIPIVLLPEFRRIPVCDWEPMSCPPFIGAASGRTTFYDPEVAVGYDYEARDSQTRFARVAIPFPYGDGVFDLFLFDEGTGDYTDSGRDILVGEAFDFDVELGSTGGLSRFSIRGIETSEMIDPNDPTGFVTGLAFASVGNSGFRMVPVTEFVFSNDPAVSIQKRTNGVDANDPTTVDVPRITPGETVTWSYVVTNTGDVDIPASVISVTDSDTSLQPMHDPGTDDGSDGILSPGESWTYTASAQSLNLSGPLPDGVTVVPGCGDDRNAYKNIGSVSITGTEANSVDVSHYCNTSLQQPVVEVNQASVTVNEGETATNSGTIIDPDGDIVTLSATVGTVTNNNDGTWLWSWVTTDGPADSQTVVITADDGNGGIATVDFALTVNNVAPTVNLITVPIDPVAFDAQPVSVSAEFSDPAFTLDQHTGTIDFGDGTAGQPVPVGQGTVSGTYTYGQAGVYPVTVTVTDKDGGIGERTASDYIVLYDASAGFVTGGGWIDSVAGAYIADPTLAGKANFGFVAKYKKGQTVPDGNTEFQFKAGDLNFKSTDYEWLVVAGAKGVFKGSGTINDLGNYGFQLRAIDAALTPSTDTDLFRIMIWDKDNADSMVYDNNVGIDEGADPTTAIGGGSIVIHTGKGNK